jgi:hypothetical protein
VHPAIGRRRCTDTTKATHKGERDRRSGTDHRSRSGNERVRNIRSIFVKKWLPPEPNECGFVFPSDERRLRIAGPAVAVQSSASDRGAFIFRNINRAADNQTCFIVRTAPGEKPFHFGEEPGRRSAAKPLTNGQARGITANIAEPTDLLRQFPRLGSC